MKIVYTQEPIPNEINKSIFLAGPSLRPEQNSPEFEKYKWRKKALEILELLEYDGVVFVPEWRDDIQPEKFIFENVAIWERKCLNIADTILFHINRNNSDGVYGLTTASEIGQWMESGKCVLSTELTADNIRYHEWWAKELKMPLVHNLYEGIVECIKHKTQDNKGYFRRDGERNIPNEIFILDIFQEWYQNQRKLGNWISDAKVLHIHRIPSNGNIFAYTLWVNIFIKSENRFKNNEFIFSRTNISSCVLYYKRPNILDSEIVLVSEFRSPVNNADGKVYELPGGSSHKPGVDPKLTIIEELKEECGFSPVLMNLKEETSRQVYATLLTHKCFLYSYKLNYYELDFIKQNQNKVFGVEADGERCYVHVKTVRDILHEQLVDWSNIGQIMSVLEKDEDSLL